MALDWLREPISAEAPCGPDLEAIDDDAFVEYYYEAESQMPERYFTPGIKAANAEFTPGVLFDRKSINHKQEKDKILSLLKRSRDLRLLSLLARLMILAGRLEDFVEALHGVADAMEAFPDDIHPRSFSDRRGALDELGNTVVVGIPLTYLEIAGAGEVSLRRYQVATGNATPREGEVGLVAGAMLSELSAPGNAKAVETTHALLSAAAQALTRIKSACLRSDNPFNPTVEPTLETIAEIQALIKTGRADLQPWSAQVQEEVEDTGVIPADADGAADEDQPATSAPRMVPAAVVTAIPTRADALQTIQAIETYFATHEPAAPALLLMTQARLLVGKPLIEAIETLLPARASGTRIDLGAETGFVLDMTRLKMLAAEAASVTAPDGPEDAPGPKPVVTNRSEVAGHLKALEEFYRAREPASPVPVLLLRAKTYLEKDFSAVVAELVPSPPKAE